MKVSIIGAGNVGSSCAYSMALSGKVKDIVLLDNKKGNAEGKAEDINHSIVAGGKGNFIIGTTEDYVETKDSDIIIIAAGRRRTTEMTRKDLLAGNCEIIKQVSLSALKYSPNAIFIITSNPLDSMVYQTFLSTKLKRSRVVGMAGLLDASRYNYILSKHLKVHHSAIKSLIIGSHNDNMVILPKYTTVNSIPLTDFLDQKTIDVIIEESKVVGREIIDLTGTSSYYAPAVALNKMVQAICFDEDVVLSASVVLDGEYGIKECALGVPIVLGKGGVKKVIEINLSEKEKVFLRESAEKVMESNRHLLG